MERQQYILQDSNNNNNNATYIYKTGDLYKRLFGEIEYLGGRIDHQVNRINYLSFNSRLLLELNTR